MILNAKDMPKVKLCKTLTADKIKRVSKEVEGFPIPRVKGDIERVNESNSSSTIPMVSPAVQDALWRMVRTCMVEGGIGLAAPQIGVFRRMFILSESPGIFRAYFNPSVVAVSESKPFEVEGCLSVPGKRIEVSRPESIWACWVEIDETGTKFVGRYEFLEGLKARAFQHETEHLNGISILDKPKRDGRATCKIR